MLRRPARTGPAGELITLERQDRNLWDAAMIEEGCALVETASPVVELNHAVAVGMAVGPAAGLALIDDLESRGELRGYHLLAAARAELLARKGDAPAAERSYRRAIEECTNPVERAFLERRLGEVGGG